MIGKSKIIQLVLLLALCGCNGSAKNSSRNENLNSTGQIIISSESITDSTAGIISSTPSIHDSTTIDSTNINSSPLIDSSHIDNSSDITSSQVTGKIKIMVDYNDGKTSNITYTLNSGDKYGSNLAFPNRTNYVFKGWFAQSNTAVEQQVTSDHTLFYNYDHSVKAKWQEYPGPGAPTYDVTYNFENEKGFDAYGKDVEYEESTKPTLIFNNCLIGNGTRNNHEGSYSLRAKKGGYLTTSSKVDGLHQITFKHAPYDPPNKGDNVQSNIYIEYSIDLSVWTLIDNFVTSNKDSSNLQSYSKYDIGIGFMIYIRVRNGIQSVDGTINIDNLRLMGRK